MVHVIQIDAFSCIPGKGNPAGVVLEAEELTEQMMQHVATRVDFNETAFVKSSELADFRIRYFTPGHETLLCGHATMGAVYALYRAGKLPNLDFTIETGAGVLPIHVEEGDEVRITMQHAKSQFLPFVGSKQELAEAIGLAETDLVEDLPIVYGSTGAWTFLVPVEKLASFAKMQPLIARFPKILADRPTCSVHPFCLETQFDDVDMHARHFSSPFSGTTEDVATGTASGVMGAYYKEFIDHEKVTPYTLVVEQGMEIEKDGRIYVHVDETIAISGTAVFVKEWDV